MDHTDASASPVESRADSRACLPDAVLRYADHDDAVVDVFLPPDEPAALLVFVHGGFWRAAYDRTHARPLARALARDGFVVAVPEYRRVGAGGGWPVTAHDVRRAVTALPALLDGLGVRTHRTTVSGHSAGGHLALWLANEGLDLDRVVALAPVGDLRAGAAAVLGDGAVQALLGGGPDERPGAYDEADPAVRFAVRPGCAVVVVHGDRDVQVPVANTRGLLRRHPWLEVRELAGADHFALIDPGSAAYPEVLAALVGSPRR